ncbi:transglycosylase SLT domain-containing protein [Erythrobacter sp. 3-20A1M]|uniref:lytic transglycosylase domain-containing protein n=1 Tax=Erythrobacter sp. 3-20A1M TaxID=2653850 RepID=UPI001BFCBB80|nr:lytic transglycosylase domain-containing protein [Erythrobacter sp. 3-20A1M]QWC55758.1 transglycosylase SLT domain-containing protein [Erythrobacter sp. 3-20A1M]
MAPKRKGFAAALIGIAALGALPAPAMANSSAVDYFRARATSSNVPQLLSSDERAFYADLFRAIDGQDWVKVDTMLAQKPDGPLTQVAMAEYYLDANSPRIELPAIQAWLAKGDSLPQAEQITNLGMKRGLMSAPYLPRQNSFTSQPYISKRILPDGIRDGTMPADIASAITERIVSDDPDGARLLLDGINATLSSAARAEWRQRVAWSYYIENQDPAAFAMAQTVAEGSGPWVAEGAWVAGLAAWRMGHCEPAAQGFRDAARQAANPELSAAGYYWASRALVRCRKPEAAAEELRGAARMDETLYGMLAREQLGETLPGAGATADLDANDWRRLRDVDNVRVAVALSEIGRDELADEVLRHQARIGDPDQFDALCRLARELGLPSTQLWMAHNVPRGGHADPSLRYPAPKWQPVDGWKVDPALAFAHSLQESNFRAAVVSPKGARGLMQIMPAAAQDHSGALGYTGRPSDLNRPEVNLAFGQRHLETLKNSGATGGLLPKVMAAYNAGLVPVGRWNSEVNDEDDPLLYMESIPYWETRGYVAIVMRNYWMYERQAAAPSPSREALAQGMWPTFPDVSSGGGPVRLSRAD